MIIIILIILVVVIDVLGISDVLKRKGSTEYKVLNVLLILLVPIIGYSIYFFTKNKYSQ